MYKGVLILIFVWLSGGISMAQDGVNLELIRRQFFKATKQGEEAEKLYRHLQSMQTNTPVLKAYLGATKALIAKNRWNPYTKINYLNRADYLLNKAVEAKGEDIEIRFLRFSVQHHIPGFLGYSDNLHEDKAVIIENLSGYHPPDINKDMINYIKKFVVESGRCTDREIKQIYSKLE